MAAVTSIDTGQRYLRSAVEIGKERMVEHASWFRSRRDSRTARSGARYGSSGATTEIIFAPLMLGDGQAVVVCRRRS